MHGCSYGQRSAGRNWLANQVVFFWELILKTSGQKPAGYDNRAAKMMTFISQEYGVWLKYPILINLKPVQSRRAVGEIWIYWEKKTDS